MASTIDNRGHLPLTSNPTYTIQCPLLLVVIAHRGQLAHRASTVNQLKGGSIHRISYEQCAVEVLKKREQIRFILASIQCKHNQNGDCRRHPGT